MPTIAGLRLFQPLTWLGPGLVLTIISGVGADAQTHPPELRKVHALLVVDTLSGLGESVKIDGERMDHRLSGSLPRDRVEIRVLTGKDVNADSILAYYRNLQVGPEDALWDPLESTCRHASLSIL